MPLKSGKSRKVIAQNIREMQAGGHPHNQAVAAALRNAGAPKKRKRRHSGAGIPKADRYGYY